MKLVFANRVTEESKKTLTNKLHAVWVPFTSKNTALKQPDNSQLQRRMDGG